MKHDVPHPQSANKTIEKVFLPEGDLYRLIMHSRLPCAQEFESWVLCTAAHNTQSMKILSIPLKKFTTILIERGCEQTLYMP